MTVEKVTTPVGKVSFYALDRPAQNGKFTASILVDLDTKEAKDFKAKFKSNKGVKEVVVDGKAMLKIGASTKFEVTVADKDGNIIMAPDNVRVNLGDIMTAKLLVAPYNYEFEGKKGSALNLHGAKILVHDTSNREEGAAGDSTSAVLEALNAIDTLATLKG